jgi:hypothetical protein
VAGAGEHALEAGGVEEEGPLAVELIDVEGASVAAAEDGAERDECVDGEVAASVDPLRRPGAPRARR